jgi:thiol-disulfide isomerase/thioredoxin
MSFETALLVLAWIAILLLALAMSGLMRQIHVLQAHGPGRSESLGPRPGTRVSSILFGPEFADRPVLAVFAEAACKSCEVILPELERLATSLNGHANVLVVTKEAAESLPATKLKVVRSPQAFSELGIRFVPIALALSQEGIVLGAEPVGSEELLKRFVRKFQATALGGAAR